MATTPTPVPSKPIELSRAAPPASLRLAWEGRARTITEDEGYAAAYFLRAGLWETDTPTTAITDAAIAAAATLGVDRDGGWECVVRHARDIVLAASPTCPPEIALPAILGQRPDDEGESLARVLACGDPRIIAWAIQRTGSWARVLGPVIDASPEDGILHECSVPGVLARILLVICPSVGTEHLLAVPQAMRTAKEARAWTMHGLTPEVET